MATQTAPKRTEQQLKEIKYDGEKVTGIFRMINFSDRKRGILKNIPIRKWKELGMYWLTVSDGDRITVPRYVANHLNELHYIKYKENHKEYSDENPADAGKPQMVDKMYRFAFDIVG